MRDAAGEPADRLHLLGLAELLLRPPMGGEVDEDARQPHELAVLVDAPSGAAHGAHLPVAVEDAELVRTDVGGQPLGERERGRGRGSSG